VDLCVDGDMHCEIDSEDLREFSGSEFYVNDHTAFDVMQGFC